MAKRCDGDHAITLTAPKNDAGVGYWLRALLCAPCTVATSRLVTSYPASQEIHSIPCIFPVVLPGCYRV